MLLLFCLRLVCILQLLSIIGNVNCDTLNMQCYWFLFFFFSWLVRKFYKNILFMGAMLYIDFFFNFFAAYMISFVQMHLIYINYICNPFFGIYWNSFLQKSCNFQTLPLLPLSCYCVQSPETPSFNALVALF